MNTFQESLDQFGEIGYVEEVVGSVVYVSGLPKIKPNEVVIFESGARGQVLGMTEEAVEVLLFDEDSIKVGTKVARTGEPVKIGLSTNLLSKSINALGDSLDGAKLNLNDSIYRPIENPPAGISSRREIVEPLETQVTLVDLIVPLAKGQRELLLGDNNTGKTSFMLQAIASQSRQGTVCIYAAIGKKRLSVKRAEERFKRDGVMEQVIVVASTASDPAGLIFLTPYTAMTIAEYFRDQGRNVLIIFDDLTTHAKSYREVALLSKRYPGRNSYPGDIFYIHSKLIERAGNFAKGAITALVAAETTMGDVSGFIQTNIMSMTDGHIFFDSELVNLGKFPPINPFLSVTRVGLQVQKPLIKEISRILGAYLLRVERARQYMHFGAELSHEMQDTLATGDKLDVFFGQESSNLVPLNVNCFLVGAIWASVWRGFSASDAKEQMQRIITSYLTLPKYRKKIDDLINTSPDFKSLIAMIKENEEDLMAVLVNKQILN